MTRELLGQMSLRDAGAVDIIFYIIDYIRCTRYYIICTIYTSYILCCIFYAMYHILYDMNININIHVFLSYIVC